MVKKYFVILFVFLLIASVNSGCNCGGDAVDAGDISKDVGRDNEEVVYIQADAEGEDVIHLEDAIGDSITQDTISDVITGEDVVITDETSQDTEVDAGSDVIIEDAVVDVITEDISGDTISDASGRDHEDSEYYDMTENVPPNYLLHRTVPAAKSGVPGEARYKVVTDKKYSKLNVQMQAEINDATGDYTTGTDLVVGVNVHPECSDIGGSRPNVYVSNSPRGNEIVFIPNADPATYYILVCNFDPWEGKYAMYWYGIE